jgi:hypothetical protein
MKGRFVIRGEMDIKKDYGGIADVECLFRNLDTLEEAVVSSFNSMLNADVDIHLSSLNIVDDDAEV